MKRLLKSRLEDLMRERGHNMKSLSLAAGLSETYVRSILKRGAEPSIKNMEAIAKELRTSAAYLLGDDKPKPVSIPIVGYASGGEGWTPCDNLNEDLEIDFASSSLISIEIRGDSMAPVYRDGDFLICDRMNGASIHNIVGRDCVVYTQNDEAFIKILKKGSSPSTYHLRSYNPVYPDIEDVKIKWAAPIIWIKRNNI